MKRITTEMVAEGMGIPVQTLRVALQYEAFDFGKAIKQSDNRYTYIFIPEKVKAAVGEETYNSWGLN